MSLTAFQLRFCPGCFMHQEHIPDALKPLLSALPTWRDDSRINDYLLTALSLNCDYEQPKGLGSLGLLGEHEFEKILYMLGAILHAKAIRSTLDASIQSQLREVIGEQGVRTCLSQVDMIIGAWPTGWQRALPSQDLPDNLLHTGLAFWLGAIDSSNKAFSQRLLLRLPKFEVEDPVNIDAKQIALARALCLKITKLVTPECLHLLN